MLNIFNILLTAAGVGFLLYGIVLCRMIQRRLAHGGNSASYGIIVVLIIFFIVGYGIFLSHLLTTYGMHQITDMLVSVVFFFGSVFVVVVTMINRQLVEQMTEQSISLESVNNQYKKINDQLSEKSLALQKSEEEQKKKNKELEKTLDDFYTMRIGVLEQIKQGTLEEENSRIKARIDQLKHQ